MDGGIRFWRRATYVTTRIIASKSREWMGSELTCFHIFPMRKIHGRRWEIASRFDATPHLQTAGVILRLGGNEAEAPSYTESWNSQNWLRRPRSLRNSTVIKDRRATPRDVLAWGWPDPEKWERRKGVRAMGQRGQAYGRRSSRPPGVDEGSAIWCASALSPCYSVRLPAKR